VFGSKDKGKVMIGSSEFDVIEPTWMPAIKLAMPAPAAKRGNPAKKTPNGKMHSTRTVANHNVA
jgi:hypothetical protein